MKTPTIFLHAAAVMIALSGAQTEAQTPQTTPQQAASPPAIARKAALPDADFVRKAATGSTFEIEAGQVAETNASDTEVKEFGQMMVKDHSLALKDLEAASQGTSAAVPAGLKLDSEHQAKLDVLTAKKGAAFDAAYKADMKKGHDETLAMLKAYQQGGTSEKLKAWVIKVLPTVEKHRDAIYAM
jgi:putative membrane protein